MMNGDDATLRLLLPQQEIEKRVRDIAAEINAVYAGEKLVVVCVLKGAFMFFSDLVKHLTMGVEVDFVRLASYGNGVESKKTVSFTKDIEISLAGKHVLIVEDVVDSGHTMGFLLRQFQTRGPKSLRVAVLLAKTERREVAVPVDFVCFPAQTGFLVGYGLDYAEQYRELPAVYALLFGGGHTGTA